MDESPEYESNVALGQLRGMLTAFAWANGKCNHGYNFKVEKLPPGTDIHESLLLYFGENAIRITEAELPEWREPIRQASQRWLFQISDSIDRRIHSNFADEDCQHEILDELLAAITVGLQPSLAWRVQIEPKGFYECAWDDFAFSGVAGEFFLHLGVSD